MASDVSERRPLRLNLVRAIGPSIGDLVNTAQWARGLRATDTAHDTGPMGLRFAREGAELSMIAASLEQVRRCGAAARALYAEVAHQTRPGRMEVADCALLAKTALAWSERRARAR